MKIASSTCAPLLYLEAGTNVQATMEKGSAGVASAGMPPGDAPERKEAQKHVAAVPSQTRQR